MKIAEVPCGIANATYDKYKAMFDNQIRYQIKNRDDFLHLVLYVEFNNEADLVIFLLTYSDQLNQIK
jgi:hypothetical protein